MKYLILGLAMLLGLYLVAARQAQSAHEFCQQARGLPSSSIEARLGKHYEVRDGRHLYDPTWIYSAIYGDTIAVQYDGEWRALRLSCGEA